MLGADRLGNDGMGELGFWVVATAISAAVAVVLLAALRRATGPGPAAMQDIQVYKDQLAEVERDLARGTIGADEAQRLRTEVSRRLLEADRALAKDALPLREGSAVLPTVMVLVAVAASLGLYIWLGAPGYPDLPLKERLAFSDQRMASRPSQAEAVAAAPKPAPPADLDPEFMGLMEKLRSAVASRPKDLPGLELLSRNEAVLGNFAAAETAQRQLIAVKGAAVTAADHAALAEIMIGAANGYVSPEAEAALVAALQLDPANPTARYFSGLMFSQAGRFDRTFVLWRALLEEGPPDAPWIAPIRAAMEEVAYRAGINYQLPPERGPSQADIEAAANMTPEERQAMIEGMVAQLSDRLASEGGAVEDWGRLIRSLAELKRVDEAQEIYDEAKTRFAGRDAELSFLRLAAVETGLTP
jgi:cytochrome c-type biogenesis protein CcmH